jgi:hypothetical protein
MSEAPSANRIHIGFFGKRNVGKSSVVNTVTGQDLAVVLLLCIQAGLLLCLSWNTSVNRTETGHLGAAVYFWHTGKFDVFRVNPPLARFAAGMPLALFCNPKYDWKSYSPRPQDRSEFSLGSAFINANEPDDVRFYLFLARAACIPFILIGSYFGYRFASELYSHWSAGMMFLLLWIFSPLVLGLGATICPDAAAASLGIVGLYFFWHWLKMPTWFYTFLAGFTLGLMILTKMTWMIAVPIWTLLYVIRYFVYRKKEETPPLSLKKFAVLLLFALYTINMGYAFDGSFRLLKEYKFISKTLTGHTAAKSAAVKPDNRFAHSRVGYIPVPLPAEFVQGIDTQKRDFEQGIESYARGVWTDRGKWWHYSYNLLLKEPLGVWVLLILALGTSLFQTLTQVKKGAFKNAAASGQRVTEAEGNRPSRCGVEMTILVPCLLVFAFISSQTGFSGHPRYVVIVLPLLYLFISKLALMRNPLFTLITISMLIWIIGSSISAYPYSLSYCNILAGNIQDRPKYLLGTNLDWGQYVYDAERWCKEHPDAKPLYTDYIQSSSLEKIGIKCKGSVPNERTAGWIIISVNDLFSRDGKRQWLRSEKPVQILGGAVWIFHVEP